MTAKFKKRAKRMSEKEIKEDPGQPPEVVKAKMDLKNEITFQITRPIDSQELHIYVKAPVLAEIVRKMDNGNYPSADYAPIYKGILNNIPDATPGRVFTKPAIGKITRNFVSGTDFSFTEPPRSILLANPDKLAEGFTLVYKMDQGPIPPEMLRKWGKQFCEGCTDIVANARAFRMTWVMHEQDSAK